MTQNILRDGLYRALDKVKYGTLTLHTPEGQSRVFQGAEPGPHAILTLNNWSVIRHMLLKGDTGFAEDYRAGLWDTPDLTALMTFGLKNDHAIQDYLFGSRIMNILARMSSFFRLNTVSGSRKNIHAHYDLGNRFYGLWLDPTMTYSSALFNHAGENLVQGQYNKYDRILERLGKKSGRLLEVGCGWGGFAERAIDTGDYDLKSITISKAQHDFAQERLKKKARIMLEDYRHQEGQFDHIVSIEMFEAVGEKFWPVYFSKLKKLLSRQGKAVIQTITIDDKHFDAYRTSGDMIRQHIFPGGMLPSPSRFAEEARKAGLKITDRFDFGLDYARTLQEWQARFEAQLHDVRHLGFDDSFIRLWRFYLSACTAGFLTQRTDVMQIELSHA